MADTKKIGKIKDGLIKLSTLIEQAHRDTLETDDRIHIALGNVKDYLNEARDTVGEWEVSTGRKVKDEDEVFVEAYNALTKFIKGFDTDVKDKDIENILQGIRGELRVLESKLKSTNSELFETKQEEQADEDMEEELKKLLDE